MLVQRAPSMAHCLARVLKDAWALTALPRALLAFAVTDHGLWKPVRAVPGVAPRSGAQRGAHRADRHQRHHGGPGGPGAGRVRPLSCAHSRNASVQSSYVAGKCLRVSAPSNVTGRRADRAKRNHGQAAARGQGHLHRYRNCDDVWTFWVQNAELRLDHAETMRCDKIKIVACSARRDQVPGVFHRPQTLRAGQADDGSFSFLLGRCVRAHVDAAWSRAMDTRR